MNNRIMTFAAAFALAPLAACFDGTGNSSEEVVAADATLATALADSDNLSTIAQALGDTGLAQTFDGAGSYTVFAPTDDVFAGLGDAGAILMEEERRPLLVAVLRDHIVPGHLTPDSIRDAIGMQDGPVEMTTLGEGTLSFAIEGSDVVVTGPDNATARIAGDAIETSNGVAIPLDSLLKAPPQ